jgi:type VI secretion system secreted protein Hcp
MAAVDFFLKIDGIQGESQDDKHKGEIEVISFSWNVARHGGKASISDFKFVKVMDRSSPILAQTASQCSSPGTAYFVARKAGRGQQEYLKITMKEVFISSVSPNSGSEVPLETVTLGFTSAEMKLAPQLPDGSLDGYVTGIVDGTGCSDKGDGRR